VVALITVAVPVHNGATTLLRCLESLSNQTCRSFKVIVFENASTDDTVKIVESFVQTDSRFEMRPSTTFLTARQNFSRAANDSVMESEFFCFRAADDYASPNFLEALLAALKSREECALAVSAVTYVDRDNVVKVPLRDSVLEFQRESGNRYRGMIFPGSWFYGLYRTRLAGAYLTNVFGFYPYAWGMDRLLVYKMIADLGIVFVPEAKFTCQVESGSELSYKAKTAREALNRRLKYYSACMEMDLHKNTNGIADAIKSRLHAWKLAGRHTGTRLGQIARLLIGKKII
jgi:glycosyltransferase involved in cell wall biosynthesis